MSAAGGLLPPLILELRARAGQVHSELQGVGKEVRKLDKETEGGLGRTGKAFNSLAGVGKAAMFGLGGAALVVGGASLKLGMDFQTSTTQLVTGAGESEAAIGGVRKGILALAPAVGQTPQQLASGMYLIESAGYHGADGLKVLKAAAQGAKVGNADMKVVADGVTTSLTDYGLKAQDATRVTSQLVATVAAGKTTMGDLAGSLHNVLPSAAAAHLGLQQVLGAMATMTGQGISADQASQDLASTIRSLQAPSQEQAAEMDALGLSSLDVAKNLGKNGLTGTMNTLVQAITKHMGPAGTVLLSTFKSSKEEGDKAKAMLDTLPASLQGVAAKFLAGTITAKEWRATLKGSNVETKQLGQEFAATVGRSRGFNDLLTKGGPAAQTFAAALSKVTGGATGMNTALALSGPNAGTFAANVKSIGSASADAHGNVAGFALAQKDLKFQFEQAKAGAEALGVKFGMFLIPKVQTLIKDTQHLVAWFGKHKTTAEVLAGVVGGVLTLAIGSYVVSLGVAVVSSAAGFVSMLAGAASWAAGTIASAASALPAILGFGQILGGIALEALSSFVSMGVEALAWGASMIAAGAMAILPFLPIIAVVGAVAFAAYELYKHWKTVWRDVKHVAEDVWHFLQHIFGVAVHAVFEGFKMYLHAYVAFWRSIWDAVSTAVSWVWNNGIKPIFSFIKRDGFDVLKAVINDFATGWSDVWNGIGAAVSWVWNNMIEPVVNTIKQAIADVSNAVGTVTHIAGNVGGALGKVGHFLGFEDGGRVPGAKGAPMLAVVHGGEYVVSNDMQSGHKPIDNRILSGSMRGSFGGGGSGGMAAASGGGGTMVLEHTTNVIVDGKVVQKTVERSTLQKGGRRAASYPGYNR